MEWYICSRDILQKNSINHVYADAIRDLLMHGRDKLRNVMITGPVKTFALKPLMFASKQTC